MTPEENTQALVNYINSIDACNQNDIWSPFGIRKKCTQEFPGGHRRNKILYANESYLIYSAISVKTKHQKHHHTTIFGTTVASWWAVKKADEVGLIIHDATFKIKKPHMQAPTPNFSIDNNENHMIIFEGGLVLNSNGTQIISYPVPAAQYPSTPFDEDVIVEFFNDNISFNQNMDITVNQVSNIFWSEVYDHVKSVFHNATGSDPNKITMLLSTPDYSIVHYTQLSERKLDDKKIVDVLDYDWGGSFSFTMNLDNNDHIITDPEEVGNPDPTISTSFSVSPGSLINFDAIHLDFTGVSRVNSTWRGSEMVYGNQE